MNQLFQMLKKLYRMTPYSFRRSSFMEKGKAAILQSERFPHDFVYDEVFFSDRSAANRSAPIIANTIVRDIGPNSVIDLGCGTGALLNSLRSYNCQVFGLENAEAALSVCRENGLNVQKFDLEKDDFTSEEFFDIAISTEVAEHLPVESADRYVDLLCQMADILIITAAVPGQGGLDHVNEQPNEYWITKFEDRGFIHEKHLSESWKNEWKQSGKVSWWYFLNLMVFRRQ